MPLRRALLATLALTLVLAQAIGLMHRIVHGPQAQRAPAGIVAQAADGWQQALFANHDDDSSCRLLDALGHDAAPLAGIALLPLALPLAVLVFLQGEWLARFSAQFDARGPPALR